MQAWETFLENLKKAPALEMHFIWNGRIEGTMILQGRSFAIHMDEIHVYCNGVEKWMYNEGFEQWEALPYDTESSDILENPSAFFSRLHHHFRVSPTSAERDKRAENPVWTFLLEPQDPSSVFTHIVICLEQDGLSPKTIDYGLTDGYEYQVKIHSFQAVPAKEKAFFTPYLLPPDA